MNQKKKRWRTNKYKTKQHTCNNWLRNTTIYVKLQEEEKQVQGEECLKQIANKPVTMVFQLVLKDRNLVFTRLKKLYI